MPKLPKWMANAMEALFSGSYTPVKVTNTELLFGKFKKVRFEGDFSSIKNAFLAGNIIEFRVSDTEFRHYTPSYFNQTKGVCEVLFYLHQKGVGSLWAENLKVGDELKLIGPGGKTQYDKQAEFHFIFGDETSIGLMECLALEAKKNGKKYLCLAETDEANAEINQYTPVAVRICKKSNENKALFAAEFTEKFLADYPNNPSKIAFYLTGNAQSIVQLRKKIKEMGITQKKQIQTEPYWAEGKQGL